MLPMDGDQLSPCSTNTLSATVKDRDTATEDLMGRQDVGVENLRAVAASGAIPARELSTIAMAKSLVSWHQRHGFCANCGSRSSMADGGWKRICPSCKTEHFPRTD
ncbi:MAG: NADH pyrophosphatase zinc ribbon domain-containing protein, partial [Paracoccus sp. (in: a-proteobacteria)]